MVMEKKSPVVIVGAGMAGCFLALCLAEKGYRVTILEKRDSVAAVLKESGRSFNITLYYRGLQALKKLNIWEHIKPLAQVAEGNVAHFQEGKIRFDRFDNTNEVLYTIHRNELNLALVNEVLKNPLISLHFHTKVVGLDSKYKKVETLNTRTQSRKEYAYDFLVGADGAYSTIRSHIQQYQPSTCSLTHSDWGYKEVLISKEKARRMNLRSGATHTWPRDNSLLLAFPNPDESLTLMFNLPIDGSDGFTSLNTKSKVESFIKTYFKDLLTLLPEITEALLSKPMGNFVTVITSPWYVGDSVVLVGDAAHAVLPFYGQGMCAAFEDCLTLTELLTKYNSDREKAFSTYQEIRKVNTDILAELSEANFIELRDHARSERFIIKDQIYTGLHKILPKLWLPPLYVLIAHGSLPYAEAVQKFKKQENRAHLLGIDVVIVGILVFLHGVKFAKTLHPGTTPRAHNIP